MTRLNIYSIQKSSKVNSIEVRPDGITKLTILNIANIKKSLLEIIAHKNTRVYLNLNSLSFIDSSAIECLNQISRIAQLNHSALILTGVSQELMELINLVKQYSILDINEIEPSTVKTKVA